MARPSSSCAVYGLSLPVGPLAGSLLANGRAQLLSTSGGTTVVSSPPMKNRPSDAATANAALLSAFLNMTCSLCRHGRGLGLLVAGTDRGGHDVVQEQRDSREDQGSGEESHDPDRLQRNHRIDKRNGRVIPLPALPEPAQPERHEKAQAADHHEPETPVG